MYLKYKTGKGCGFFFSVQTATVKVSDSLPVTDDETSEMLTEKNHFQVIVFFKENGSGTKVKLVYGECSIPMCHQSSPPCLLICLQYLHRTSTSILPLTKHHKSISLCLKSNDKVVV